MPAVSEDPNRTTRHPYNRYVPSLVKPSLCPFVKGQAQRTGDLSPQIMTRNLVWSDLESARASSSISRIMTNMARRKSLGMSFTMEGQSSAPLRKHCGKNILDIITSLIYHHILICYKN
jgi:hypothetical protein